MPTNEVTYYLLNTIFLSFFAASGGVIVSDLQCSTTMEDEVSAEFRCETNECHTEIRWFVGDTEVHDGGTYKVQQIGNIHRLVIENLTLSDTATVTAVARMGTSKLESRLNMKGNFKGRI